MPRGLPWAVAAAVAAATVGVYFLLGAAWATRIGYDFAGPARPVLGLALLAASVALLAWDARARRRAARPPVVLYTRETCSLCDEARALLAKAAAETGFEVWEQDVDRDPSLQEAYGDRVPVAVLGDEVLFELRADYARLRARLAERAK